MENKTWEYDGWKDAPKHVTTVTLGDRVHGIGNLAFDDCSRLVSIHNIHESVITSIGSYAFRGCTSLRSIRLPSSIDTISEGAFCGCTSLTTVVQLDTLPITEIGTYTFRNCTSLVDIQFPPTLQSIRSNAFSNCTSLTTLKLPPSIVHLDSRCFSNCTSLTRIDIPYNVEKIHPRILRQCSSLESIRFYTISKHKRFQQHHFDFLATMIQTNPRIADRPCSTSTDCLPLHFVLLHGFACEKWKKIAMIAKAAPRAYAIRDPIHHFYPFLLAACDPPIQYNNDKDRLGQYKKWFVRYDLEQLNSVYMLLRESAWVMDFLVQNYRTN